MEHLEKQKSGKMDHIIEGLCLVMLFGMTCYLAIGWKSFPDQVPVHADLVGNIDRWGKKSEMLILPVVMWILYIGITLVEGAPSAWNTGVTVTKENKEHVYRTLKYLLGTQKLIMLTIFTGMTVCASLAVQTPGWFFPSMLVAVFGDIVFWLVRLYRRH